MAFINNLLGKIFGNKSERDIKEVTPVVEKIKEEYNRIIQGLMQLFLCTPPRGKPRVT